LKIVTAPPGAGKTEELKRLIEESLERGISPYLIFATTFAREAAKEISNRVGGDVSVRTNHGTGFWIIRLVRQTRGEPVPRIITANRSLSLIERIIKERNLKFTEPKQVLDDLANVRERGGRIDAIHPTSRQVIDMYTQVLAQENLLDFTSILSEAERELDDPDLRNFLQGIRVYVDEGQDSAPRSVLS